MESFTTAFLMRWSAAGVILAALGAGLITGWVLGPQFFWVGAMLVWLLAGNWPARAGRVVLNLVGLRASISPGRLLVENMPSDPYNLLHQWMKEEEDQSGFAAARAMVLATSSPADGATARTVICQQCGEQCGGLVVATNGESLKSRQIHEDPRVETVFRWGDRQVRVRGRARLGDAVESDNAWITLSREQRLGLTLLQQGEPCSEMGHVAISKAWRSLALKHGCNGDSNAGAAHGTLIPRPQHFSALIVQPESFEFYTGGHPGYVNDRFLYTRRAESNGAEYSSFELVGRLQA